MSQRLGSALIAAALPAGCGDNLPPAPEWNDEFASAVARPEHPRPDLRRDSFISLNTRWQFAYDPDDAGLAKHWQRQRTAGIWREQVQLPFAWESPLSGLVPPHQREYQLGDTLASPTYRGVGWYRLELPGYLPAPATGQHWYLVFGAVDFRATVFVNGDQVAEHQGGYDPFAVDLSAATAADQAPVIVVRVEDRTDLDLPVGPLTLTAPVVPGAAALIAEVFDQDDQRVAANRVTVTVVE